MKKVVAVLAVCIMGFAFVYPQGLQKKKVPQELTKTCVRKYKIVFVGGLLPVVSFYGCTGVTWSYNTLLQYHSCI